MSKTLLIIAHEFAPISGGRVMRMIKFAKYLPEYDWSPIVLSAHPDDCFYSHEWWEEPDLLSEISRRTRIIQVHSPLEAKAKTFRKWIRGMRSNNLSAKPNALEAGEIKLSPFRVSQDYSALWNPFAYWAALKILQEETIDAVLTTSPPHLLQSVGVWLKQRTNLPWVADFRDGWSGNPLFEAKSSIRRIIDHQLEKSVIEHADLKLVVTQHMRNHFQNTYPPYADTFRLLHNGFDPEDFSEKVETSTSSCTILHIGSLVGYRDPRPFLFALNSLVTEGSVCSDAIVINFVGKGHQYTDQFPRLRIQHHDPVDHSQAVRMMQKSSILLLITGREEGEAAFTGKIFEYLAARRPILALVPDQGELANLLREYPLAITSSLDDVEGIKKAILKVIALTKDENHNPGTNLGISNNFNRKFQAGRLAAWLNELVARVR